MVEPKLVWALAWLVPGASVAPFQTKTWSGAVTGPSETPFRRSVTVVALLAW